MKWHKGLFWILTGTMLLAAALFLVLHNINEDLDGQMMSDSILSELKSKFPEPPEPTEPPLLPEFGDDLAALYGIEEKEEIPEDVLIEIDGMYYLGMISIPSINIELPVLSEWSYPNLKISPCRYKGGVYTGDLIVAAHNYRSHFGRIQELNSGDSLYFTDGIGVVHKYQITQSELIEGKNIEAMEFGSADSWDLTLFTCTLSGQSRVTIRAIEVDQ